MVLRLVPKTNVSYFRFQTKTRTINNSILSQSKRKKWQLTAVNCGLGSAAPSMKPRELPGCRGLETSVDQQKVSRLQVLGVPADSAQQRGGLKVMGIRQALKPVKNRQNDMDVYRKYRDTLPGQTYPPKKKLKVTKLLT